MSNFVSPIESFRPKKVCLLKGGWSRERSVSLTSSKGILKALQSRGYDVDDFELTRDLKALTRHLESTKPDVVCLNGLHGQFVEDGTIQAVLEILKIPYTGSDVTASAVAFNKKYSRALLQTAKIPVPDGDVLGINDVFSASSFQTLSKRFGVPFVIKPLCEGSSIGVTIVHEQPHLEAACADWSFGPEILVERYVPGRELSVGIIGAKALDILELKPSRGFYDFEAKCVDGITEHIMPADLEASEKTVLLETSERVVKCLGVTGATRVDFRYDDSNPHGQRHFVLELNSLPGMTPISILPEIAAYGGISYEDLCEWMIQNPVCPR